MKVHSFVVIIVMCCIFRYISVEIMPELKKHYLKYGYRINSKYERMLAHSFDRFYVATKFISPSVNDLNIFANLFQ